jgi:hypothetical protein
VYEYSACVLLSLVLLVCARTMSKTSCKVLRPTLTEFADFASYIRVIDEELEEQGIVKVVPPAGTSPAQALHECRWLLHPILSRAMLCVP